jgi:septal ring-binding cell division protein DamX
VRPPTTLSPSRPGQTLAEGAQQLRSGKYPEAAATFLSHLRKVGADKFTIAVGVFCDTENVERVVNNSGGSEELILLAFDNRGRSCYRVFWGIFDSRAQAESAVGSVPAGVRARDSAPVPIARLLP